MTPSRFAVLEISGTPRQRGRVHGEGLRPLIAERDRCWRQEIETRTKISADDFIEDFLQRTNFTPAIERWTPDLHEEVKGIAEGSGLSYRAILAAQFMDEEWWFQRQYRNHCSSFGAAARDGHPVLVGQTMDLPNWMDGFQTLLLIRGAQPGLDAYVVTAAGMIALTGMNSRGLGVSVNTLMQLNSSADGLPVAFITRRLIETPVLGEAVRFSPGGPPCLRPELHPGRCHCCPRFRVQRRPRCRGQGCGGWAHLAYQSSAGEPRFADRSHRILVGTAGPGFRLPTGNAGAPPGGRPRPHGRQGGGDAILPGSSGISGFPGDQPTPMTALPSPP